MELWWKFIVEIQPYTEDKVFPFNIKFFLLMVFLLHTIFPFFILHHASYTFLTRKKECITEINKIQSEIPTKFHRFVCSVLLYVSYAFLCFLSCEWRKLS